MNTKHLLSALLITTLLGLQSVAYAASPSKTPHKVKCFSTKTKKESVRTSCKSNEVQFKKRKDLKRPYAN